MANSPIHPAAVLVAWLAILVGVQALGFAPLLALLLLTLVGARQGMRRRWKHLAWRSRWLIAVLCLTFLLSTPGEALVAGMPATGEGVYAAGEHAARFLMILATVAWLLDMLSIAELMAGLHGLFSPGARIGLSTDRAVARLALVLEYVEDGRIPVWRTLVDAAPDPLATAWVEIERRPVRARDRAVVVLAGLLLALALSA